MNESNGHSITVARQGTWGSSNDFLDKASSDALESTQAGTMSHVAREEAELKAAIVVARRFPRDEVAAYQRIITSCARPSFAASAAYTFPRAGQQVTGPSVDLAREMARCWGNVRYGLRVVSEDVEAIHIKGYAFDLECNNLVEAEDKFRKLIFRKKGGWVAPDERDLRELVNRRGAILVRNCLLQILPPDITEDALRKADETNERAANGDLEQDPQSAIRSMVGAFSKLSVTPEMIAGYVGHPLTVLSAAELADLRKVYASIRDGNTRREDHFDVGGPKPAAESASRTDALAERLGSSEAKVEAAATPSQVPPAAVTPAAEPPAPAPVAPPPTPAVSRADALVAKLGASEPEPAEAASDAPWDEESLIDWVLDVFSPPAGWTTDQAKTRIRFVAKRKLPTPWLSMSRADQAACMEKWAAAKRFPWN